MTTAELLTDVATIFQDFERYFDAHRRAKPAERAIRDGHDPLADERDALLLQWLDDALASGVVTRAERRAALDEYDRRRAVEAERDADDARLWAGRGYDERWRFEAWVQARAAEFPDPTDAAALAAWDEAERARKRAEAVAAAEAERRMRDERDEAAYRRELEAATRDREAADRAAAERDALAGRLADPAWVRGEDDASLRAVAAWLRNVGGAVTLTLREGAARTGLTAATQALDAEVRARQHERGAARDANDDVLRLARGGPPVEVPDPIDVAGRVDPDAIGRWLAAHRGDLTAWSVGRWETQRWTDDGKAREQRVLTAVSGWDRIADRRRRWTVWAGLAELATEHPDTADALRAQGLDVLLGRPVPAPIQDQLDDVDYGWSDQPDVPDAAPAPPRRRPAARPASARVEEVTTELAAVTVWRRFQAKGVRPTTRLIVQAMRAAGAKGKDAALRAAYQAVEATPDQYAGT